MPVQEVERRRPIARRRWPVVERVLSLGDEPTDDDDLRLHKRVGVVAGLILVAASLQLPFLAQGHPFS